MVDDKCYYTHLAPSAELMSMFRRRRDNQIMGLELLSISLGLCTFENLIRGLYATLKCRSQGKLKSCGKAFS